MKLRLVSTGLTRGTTKIINEETGEMLEHVEKAEILLDANGPSKVILTMFGMDLDITIPCEDDILDKLTKKESE